MTSSAAQSSVADDDDNWVVECSDEERYNGDMSPNHTPSWHPPAEEILRLYEALNDSGVVEFEWQCPGRRAPSPQPDLNEAEKKDGLLKAAAHDKKKKPATEFDFDDGFMESLSEKIAPRRITGGSTKLKGSGQKRVANFQNVMCDIRRQMKLEQLDTAPAKGGSQTKKGQQKKSD